MQITKVFFFWPLVSARVEQSTRRESAHATLSRAAKRFNVTHPQTAAVLSGLCFNIN